MEKKEFHLELDSFELHLPGRNVESFCNNEVLKHFMCSQYPHWQSRGHVTSIPIGRVPRLFLTGNQMTESLAEQFTSLQKGESGEIYVYKSLLDASSDMEDGILVLPNMDGNHFRSKAAHVELDTVVVHSKKGIFVINVKNANIVDEKQLVLDMEKHTRFIRLLRDYNGSSIIEDIILTAMQPIIPVHGIICSLQKEINLTRLGKHGYWNSAQDNEERFVFQPNEMEEFSSKWKSMLSVLPCLKYITDRYEVLIARLAVLNSMEGAVAYLHNKIISGEMQTIYKKPNTRKDVLQPSLGHSSTNTAVNQLDENLFAMGLNGGDHVDSKKKKKPVILWTNEQLEILSRVVDMLLKPTGRPCRFIVTGPKGSGKTMMLIYIARLAKHILHFHNKDHDGKVIICDGRVGSSQLMFETLEDDFKGSGIDVVKAWPETDNKRHDVFAGRELILFDECIGRYMDYIDTNLKKVKSHQSVILFSSDPTFHKTNEYLSSYQVFSLTTTLRSTQGITRFVDKFRLLDPLSQQYPVIAAHNLEGACADVRSISIDIKEDPHQLKYVSEAVRTITESVENARGLQQILVTPFVHPITLQGVINELHKQGFDYTYRNPVDFLSKSVPLEKSLSDDEEAAAFPSKLPQICFVTGNHVDGCEYGAVVVLLERSLPNMWDEYIFDSMYTAITRATSKLSIVINNTNEAPAINEKSTQCNEEAIPMFWKKLSKPHDVSIRAYHLILSSPDNYPEQLQKIISDSCWSKHPVLILGKFPHVPDLKEIETPASILSDCFKKVDVKRLPTNAQSCSTNASKWYQWLNGKLVVSSPHFHLIMRHLEEEIHHDLKMLGFSAIVFLMNTLNDYYKKFLNQVDRHRLLYNMYEHQLGNCPIYVVSSFPLVPSRLRSSYICDLLCVQDNTNNEACHKHENEITEPLHELTWEDLKAKGTTYFKRGALEEALSSYKESMKKLRTKCGVSIATVKVKSLIHLRDELSKLHSNISKVYFDIGQGTKNNTDMSKMESSLQHAEKSVEIDPFWEKGYHRMAEAMQQLGDVDAADNARKQMVSIANVGELFRCRIKRDNVLKSKMAVSDSWELIRFKENVFLVDKDGEGHFKSIPEALSAKGLNSISLLINAGVYEQNISLDKGADVDLVGNWKPSLCDKNKWILEDSPIVIQDIANKGGIPLTIFAMLATLSLSRVSIYNWQPFSAHAVSGTCSSVTLFECSFKSQCGAAVMCKSQSNLVISGCRCIDTYEPVLVADSSVNIVHSMFKKVKMIGLEFRENVSASIENCFIKQCGGQGICSRYSKIRVNSCLLESNALKMSNNEGSIQLHCTDATISKTFIQNQLGNGIVIESGKGEFDGLDIDRCKSSGMLIQAPTMVSHCKIKNCQAGITICRNIDGDVVFEGNKITQCKLEVFRFPNAKLPITKGVVQRCNKVSEKATEMFKVVEKHIGHGQVLHEKTQLLHNLISRSNTVLGHVLGVTGAEGYLRGCQYCTKVDHENLDKYLLCQKCESVIYCSNVCLEKHKEAHEQECVYARELIKAYRDSIDFNGHGNKKKTTLTSLAKEECSSDIPCSVSSSSTKSGDEKKRKKKGSKKKRKH